MGPKPSKSPTMSDMMINTVIGLMIVAGIAILFFTIYGKFVFGMEIGGMGGAQTPKGTPPDLNKAVSLLRDEWKPYQGEGWTEISSQQGMIAVRVGGSSARGSRISGERQSTQSNVSGSTTKSRQRLLGAQDRI